ncbi:WhiB family transcriptional regulator [Streptomyces sp. SID12488]|uniref:WhiB family transcriptional regulator n=1 Tax=Streptomyces sp. SID12488 TaxID=2706040 RepID=UPI0013D94862|nr:WhiB family transcriptional regulator [Streptomyces sp. SID12488]NEA61336.1 WhiB family transcriptional regulator [Streptomyces sp. SID12488]
MTSLAALTATTPNLPCRTDPTAFFSPDPTERQHAARQCHRCPLLLACMQYALANQERFGVWAGVDFAARAIGCGTERAYQIHKRRKEQVCPQCQAAHDEAIDDNRRRLLAEAHAAGGTARGHRMHRRLGEASCVPCKAAQARQSKARREMERAAGDRARAEWDARKAAGVVPGAQAGAQSLAIAS